MKKLLLASIVLSVCSFSILLFQISCTKTANAQTSGYTLPPATTSTLGGVIIGSGLAVSSNGTLSTTSSATGLTQLNKIVIETAYAGDSLLILNYDGSNPMEVTLPVPAGQSMVYGGQDVVLSPDGKTLFFQTTTTGSYYPIYIYSCSVTGGGVKLIYTASGPNTPLFVGAY